MAAWSMRRVFVFCGSILLSPRSISPRDEQLNGGTFGTTLRHDQRVQLAGKGRDDAGAESAFRDNRVLSRAASIVGHRQRPFRFDGIAHHHMIPPSVTPPNACFSELITSWTTINPRLSAFWRSTLPPSPWTSIEMAWLSLIIEQEMALQKFDK